ncbi:hypothetical protein GCM10020331_081730 [Ectobacillus funiculus]
MCLKKKRYKKSLVQDIVTLINTQAIMNNIQILVEFEPDIPIIVCEENQLKQVFINVFKKIPLKRCQMAA